MLAKSGLLAKVVRFSTASRSGAVATRHLFLFSSEKSPSKAWNKTVMNICSFGCFCKCVTTYTHICIFSLDEKDICNKFTLNVLISWRVDLDGFDEVGCGVGHLFGWLDKLSPSHWVGSFRRGQATGVTESRGVLGYNCGCRQDLMNKWTKTINKEEQLYKIKLGKAWGHWFFKHRGQVYS